MINVQANEVLGYVKVECFFFSFRDGAYRLSRLKEKVLRIDKCNNFSTAGMFYTNVSRLMQDDPHW